MGIGRASWTHCLRGGHELTAENTILQPNGARVSRLCRICRTTALARYAEAKRVKVRAYNSSRAPENLARARKAKRPPAPAVERFWAKVAKDGPIHPVLGTPCWLWTAARNRFGYGEFKAGGHTLAHRFSWELHNGPRPERLFVLHHCDVPACVNPAHLFLGTYLDNARDAAAKGRVSNQFKDSTHCPQGHPRVAPHVRFRKNGERKCHTCTMERQRVQRARLRRAS